jgi:predicted nuclease of predicted toxin-antitoxin system
MRLLADESCDFAIVRGLRSAGHDVTSIAEILRGASDEQVIDLAASERRLLITEDKDFGQLVFSAARENSGVLLVRYPALARSGLVDAMLALVAKRGKALYSCFVVLEPGRIRLSRLA